MKTRSYDFTPVRESNLTAAVAAANAPIQAANDAAAKQTPPGAQQPLWTNDTYWQVRNDDFLDSYGRQHQTDIASQAVQAFMTAPQDKQGQLLTLLGMADYAALPPAALAKALGTIGLTNFMALTPDQQNEAFALAGLGS